MGSGPDINYPAQPSYGEGMADAMKAQMEQLLGQGDYAQMYADAGFAGGNLGDIVAGVEGPIRQQTAQVDTDVLRQTLLGSQTKVVKDPETGKYGIPSAEQVDLGSKSSDRYSIFMISEGSIVRDGGHDTGQGRGTDKVTEPVYALIDNETGGMKKYGGGVKYPYKTESTGVLEQMQIDVFKEVQGAQEKVEVSKETGVEFTFDNPYTGEPLKEGEVVREGDGMIDLLGDRRQAIGTTQVDKAPREYIKDIYRNIVGREPDEEGLNYWSQRIDNPSDMQNLEEGLLAERAEKLKAGQDVPAYTEGSYTDLRYSRGFGDLGRQAGFDAEGNFLGLAALAEDIQRGNLSRQREADLADVERLADRYSAVMEDFAPATVSGVTGARDLIEEQKENLTSANTIVEGPSGSTYGGDITAGTMKAASVGDPLALSASTSYNPSASVSGGTFDANTSYNATKVADPMKLTAATSYDPSDSVSGDGYTATAGLEGGEVGQDAFRQALMEQATAALDNGLSDRELANISNAARARQTMMGRTFDQSGAIQEAQALVAEDNNRRMQNRAFAQEALDQEADIRERDLGRGLQAAMQNQAALNRAAEFGASQDMQAQLANQAATNQALSQGLSAGLSQEALAAQQQQAKAMADATAANRASEFGVSAGLQQEAQANQAALQAQLANQQATNQAAQFGVGAGMEQDALRAQLGQQTNLAQAELDQQAAAFGADAAQRARQANQAQKQQAAQFGVGATMDAQRINETLRQQGLGNYINAVGNLSQIEKQTSLDPFQALLGRGGGGSLASGQSVFGQASYGLNSGPQYLNPESGLGYISNMAANQANMYAAQQAANASRSAGLMGGLGAIGGGLFGGLASAGKIF